MISRRDFLRGSTALALTPMVDRILNHHEHFEEPLLVGPKVTKRVFYMHQDCDNGHRIVTDALPFPRRILTLGAVEREFGKGAYRKMSQRDHWRLIDQGRFGSEDTMQPAFPDVRFDCWCANYSPEAEAYTLLEDIGLGPDKYHGKGCGLTFFDSGECGLNPAVFCNDTRAVSLLQAELVRRNIPIEIRMEERQFENITIEEILKNGGNVLGL